MSRKNEILDRTETILGYLARIEAMLQAEAVSREPLTEKPADMEMAAETPDLNRFKFVEPGVALERFRDLLAKREAERVQRGAQIKPALRHGVEPPCSLLAPGDALVMREDGTMDKTDGRGYDDHATAYNAGIEAAASLAAGETLDDLTPLGRANTIRALKVAV